MSERDKVLEELLEHYYSERASSDAEVSGDAPERLASAAYRAGMLRAAEIVMGQPTAETAARAIREEADASER